MLTVSDVGLWNLNQKNGENYLGARYLTRDPHGGRLCYLSSKLTHCWIYQAPLTNLAWQPNMKMKRFLHDLLPPPQQPQGWARSMGCNGHLQCRLLLQLYKHLMRSLESWNKLATYITLTFPTLQKYLQGHVQFFCIIQVTTTSSQLICHTPQI